MSADINAIRRTLLIKYPMFGSTIANLRFEESTELQTAGTDGKIVFYNPEYLSTLPKKQQIFLFAHEVCHVVFEHMTRSKGKDKKLWNIATDSVINALLQQDGLPLIEGGVDIPEAVNFDAEEMYKRLLEESKKKEQSQTGDNEEQQGEGASQDREQDNQTRDTQQSEESDVGHDTHSLWDRAIEEEERQQEEQKEEKTQVENSKNQEEQKEDKSVSEKDAFENNKEERKKQLKELSKNLAHDASTEPGKGTGIEGRTLSDIGIATPIIDWRRLLKQATKYEEEYTRKNARMRNGFFRHRLEQNPIPESEILLDVSGSVSENLLKNFLRECKNIIETSRVKVGCFNTEFHGFTELRRPEDIDRMNFPTGGGTDFDVAVQAFSKRVANKIIFTDGEAPMPEKMPKNIIWVVFGNKKINPIGCKVINITGDQLRRLYQPARLDRTR